MLIWFLAACQPKVDVVRVDAEVSVTADTGAPCASTGDTARPGDSGRAGADGDTACDRPDAEVPACGFALVDHATSPRIGTVLPAKYVTGVVQVFRHSPDARVIDSEDVRTDDDPGEVFAAFDPSQLLYRVDFDNGALDVDPDAPLVDTSLVETTLFSYQVHGYRVLESHRVVDRQLRHVKTGYTEYAPCPRGPCDSTGTSTATWLGAIVAGGLVRRRRAT